jgi:hypothetical protein
LSEFHSFSQRNLSNVDPNFKDEFNLDLQEPNLLHLKNERIYHLINPAISLDTPNDHQFINEIGTTYIKTEYFSNVYLFDYNGVLYCHINNNADFITSIKNKLEVLQSFNLQKLRNTEINKEKDKFMLFVLGKHGAIYFCLLKGNQLVIIESKHKTMQSKLNGPKSFIFLYNSKGEPCCIADISNNELDIVIY